MAKAIKKIDVEEAKTPKGYNENNPAQPEGAFKADSIDTAPKDVVKPPRKNTKDE